MSPSSVALPAEGVRTGVQRAIAIGLSLWAVGVQVAEPFAAAGMAVCALAALVSARDAGVDGARAFARAWWPVLAFVGWALIVPALAGRPPSGSGVARTLDWVGVPLAAWAVARMAPEQRERIVWWVVGVLLVSSAVAGLQHYGIWPSREAMRPFDFTRIPFERVYEQVPGTTDRFMGGGLLFHRLKFSHVGGLVVLGLLAFGLSLSGRRRWTLSAAAVLGLLAIVVFPFARAAAVALIGGAALVVAVSIENRRRALAAAGALLLIGTAGILLHAPLRERLLRSVTAEGSGDRHLLLGAGVKAVIAHPIAGLGPGRFRSGAWADPSSPTHVLEQQGKAHNQVLSMAAETGVPGAILFVVMLVAIVRRIRLDHPGGRAAAGAFTFFALLSVIHDPLFQPPFSMALPLLLGLGLVERER